MSGNGTAGRGERALGAALLVLLLVAVALRGGVAPGAAAGLRLAVAGLGACALLLRRLPPVSPAVLLVALAWSSLALGSTSWSVEPDATLDAAAAMLAAVLVFVLGASLLGPGQRERFLRGLAASGAIVALVALAMAGHEGRAHAPFGNPNHLGAWLLLPGAIAAVRLRLADLRRRGRRESAILWFGVLGVICAGLAVSESRGAALAALVAAGGILAMLWTGVWPVAGGLLAASVALAVLPPLFPDLLPMYVVTGESSVGIRWGVYAAAANAALDAAPLGVGLGGFASVFAAYRPAGLPYAVQFAHSEPLQALTELGVPYLAALAFTAVLVAKRVVPRLGRRAPGAAFCGASALLALAVHSLIDFPLHVPALALAGAALAGLTWSAFESGCPRLAPVHERLTRLSVGLLALALAGLAGSEVVALGSAARAQDRIAVGDFRGAERVLRAGLRVRPRRAGLLALRADAAEGAFRLDGGGRLALLRALDARTQAAGAAPRRAPACVELANTRALAGDFSGALADVERAVRLDPQSPAPRVAQARLLLGSGRKQGAAAALRGAVARHPEEANRMLGALFRLSGDPSLVRAALPDLAGPRRRAGRLLAAAGYPTAAAEELAAALELGPPDARTALESARAFLRADDAEAAKTVLKRTLARLPDDPTLRGELAALESAGADAGRSRGRGRS